MTSCIKPNKTPDQRKCERKKNRRLFMDKIRRRPSKDEDLKADRGRCNEYHVLKLAVEYDSTFCKDRGGNKQSSEREIRKLVKQVNDFYSKGKPCVTIDLFHLDGQCDSNNDLWKDVTRELDGEKRLQLFRDKFKLVRADVNKKQTVAHLYTGSGTSMKVKSGVTYPRSLCKPNGRGFGVMVFTDQTDINCPTAKNLIIHELGHNIGVIGHSGCPSEHVLSAPFCYDCASFTKSDLKEMEAGLKNKHKPINCLTTINAPISIDSSRTLEPKSIDTDIPKAELGIITEQDQVPDIFNVLPIVTTLLMMFFGRFMLSKFRKA